MVGHRTLPAWIKSMAGAVTALYFGRLRSDRPVEKCLHASLTNPTVFIVLYPAQVKYVLLSEPRLPEELSSSLDFIILYDVLVHVDLHITNKYIREIARVLKPGGKAFLSTANFLSPGERFIHDGEHSSMTFMLHLCVDYAITVFIIYVVDVSLYGIMGVTI